MPLFLFICFRAVDNTIAILWKLKSLTFPCKRRYERCKLTKSESTRSNVPRVGSPYTSSWEASFSLLDFLPLATSAWSPKWCRCPAKVWQSDARTLWARDATVASEQTAEFAFRASSIQSDNSIESYAAHDLLQTDRHFRKNRFFWLRGCQNVKIWWKFRNYFHIKLIPSHPWWECKKIQNSSQRLRGFKNSTFEYLENSYLTQIEFIFHNTSNP